MLIVKCYKLADFVFIFFFAMKNLQILISKKKKKVSNKCDDGVVR